MSSDSFKKLTKDSFAKRQKNSLPSEQQLDIQKQHSTALQSMDGALQPHNSFGQNPRITAVT